MSVSVFGYVPEEVRVFRPPPPPELGLQGL